MRDSFGCIPLNCTSRITLVLASTLLFLVLVPPKLFAQSAIGHVLEIQGDWYLYPGGADSNEAKKLSRWQDVPPGGVIRIKAPSIDDHISIVDIHLNMLVAKKCDGPNTCYQPIFLPRDLKESGVSDELNSLLIGAWNLLWGEPYESSLHRTRGAPPQLEEGVAQINSHAVDFLSELMQHMRKGRYSLVAYEQKRGETNQGNWFRLESRHQGRQYQ